MLHSLVQRLYAGYKKGVAPHCSLCICSVVFLFVPIIILDFYIMKTTQQGICLSSGNWFTKNGTMNTVHCVFVMQLSLFIGLFCKWQFPSREMRVVCF